MQKEVNELSVADEFKLLMRIENRRNKIASIAPLIILVIMITLMSIFIESFLTSDNITSILNQLAIPLVISLGLTFVIILGSIDLSVEGATGFVGSIVTLMVVNTKTDLDFGFWAIIIAIIAGSIVGLIVGFIHVKTRLPSFMVTFAVSSIMGGFAVLSYQGVPALVQDPMFMQISQASFIGIPAITWCSFVMLGIAFVIQRYTAFGRHIYAIGDNENVLRNNGVNIDKIKILVFLFSGFCIAVAGVLGAIRIGRGDVMIGRGTLFPSITAVVVGGTALSGGKGGVINTLIGTFIVVTIQNALILLGIDPYIQGAIQGLIIIFAVSFSIARGKKVIVK